MLRKTYLKSTAGPDDERKEETAQCSCSAKATVATYVRQVGILAYFSTSWPTSAWADRICLTEQGTEDIPRHLCTSVRSIYKPTGTLGSQTNRELRKKNHVFHVWNIKDLPRKLKLPAPWSLSETLLPQLDTISPSSKLVSSFCGTGPVAFTLQSLAEFQKETLKGAHSEI